MFQKTTTLLKSLVPVFLLAFSWQLSHGETTCELDVWCPNIVELGEYEYGKTPPKATTIDEFKALGGTIEKYCYEILIKVKDEASEDADCSKKSRYTRYYKIIDDKNGDGRWNDGESKKICIQYYWMLPVPPITPYNPGNREIDPCKTQADIDYKFGVWLQGFYAEGGIDPVSMVYDVNTGNDPVAPPICGGTVTVKLFAYDQACLSSEAWCEATFTVNDPKPLSIICPDYPDAISCAEYKNFRVRDALCTNRDYIQDQECLIEDYVSGEIIQRPDGYCGGYLVILYKGKDNCDREIPAKKCSIMVEPAPLPVTYCPDYPETITCEEYQDFKPKDALCTNREFIKDDGCLMEGYVKGEIIERPDDYCGGYLVILYKGKDECDRRVEERKCTIIVEPAPLPVTYCPDYPESISCEEYQDFKPKDALCTNREFIKDDGCLMEGYVEGEIIERPDDYCGGYLVILYKGKDECDRRVEERKCTIVVEPAPLPVTYCPDYPESISCEEYQDFKPKDALCTNREFIKDDGCLMEGYVEGEIIERPDDYCGGYLVILYKGKDECDRRVEERKCTIIVEPAPLPVTYCPDYPESISCEEYQHFEPIDALCTNRAFIQDEKCLMEGYVEGEIIERPDDVCGGYLVILYKGKDECDRRVEERRCSIMVEPPPLPVIYCPDYPKVISCTEYHYFEPLEAKYSNRQYINDEKCLIEGYVQGEIIERPDDFCGGYLVILYEGKDDCDRDLVAIRCSIEVEAATPPEIICPDFGPITCEEAKDFVPPYAIYDNDPNSQGEFCDIEGEVAGEIIGRPEKCGGKFVVKYTLKADHPDNCTDSDIMKTCEFIVLPPDAPKINCDIITEGLPIPCYKDLAGVIAADSLLLSSTIMTDCDLEAELKVKKPDFLDNCNGTEYEVVYYAMDECGNVSEQCTLTYEIKHELPEAKCSPDYTAPKCSTLDELQLAWSDWIKGFSGSAGDCGGMVKYYLDGVEVSSFPEEFPGNICGSMNTIKVLAYNDCDREKKECESTFKVPEAEEIKVQCPDNMTITSCKTQAEINQAFADWLDEFTYIGGCDATESELEGVPPTVCEGGMVTVTYEVYDKCSRDECTRTFTVDIEDANNLNVYCPSPVTEEPDQTQAAIDAAFEIWKSGFGYSGGCETYAVYKIGDEVIDLDTLSAPHACGGDVKVKLVGNSLCMKDSCESEFVVIATGQALLLALPGGLNECKTTPGVPTKADVPPARPDEEVIGAYLIVSDCVPFESIMVEDVCTGPVIDGVDYIFTRTYTVTADGVPPAEASEIFVIRYDPNPPVLTGVPGHLSLPCGSDLPSWPTVTAYDDIDGIVEVIRGQKVEEGVCGQNVYIRYWTAKDECGNEVTEYQTIIIGGNEDPLLIVPNDTTIYCGQEIPEPWYELDENRCVDVDVDFTEEQIGSGCEYDIKRTWVAKDRCGNSTTAMQLIQFRDNVAPVIKVVNPMIAGIENGGEMIVYGCDNPQVQMGDIEVLGECCGAADIELKDELIGANLCDLYGYYRKWRCSYTVTDEAGNVSVFYFDVLQYDTTAPEILNVPEDLHLECGAEFPPADPHVIVDDDCSMATTPKYEEAFFTDPADTNKVATVRTWWYEDACGNRGEESQVITICGFDTMLLKANVGNNVWHDANFDGIQDADESGLDDVKVYLYSVKENAASGRVLIDSTVSQTVDNVAGHFEFKHLEPAAYQLEFVAPENMSITNMNQGADDTMDSDVDPTTGMTGIFHLHMADDVKDIDAGFVPTISSDVGLSSFVATNHGCENRLIWQTESEVEIEKYVVQRSNGGEYIAIGELNAIGGPDLLVQYEFEDPAPKSANLYRLKIMDMSGYARYSDIRSASANCDGDSNTDINVFPNPTQGNAQVSFTTEKSGEVTITLFDQLGTELSEIQGLYDRGRHVEQIKLADMPQGFYYVRINQDGAIGNQTVIKSE